MTENINTFFNEVEELAVCFMETKRGIVEFLVDQNITPENSQDLFNDLEKGLKKLRKALITQAVYSNLEKNPTHRGG